MRGHVTSGWTKALIALLALPILGFGCVGWPFRRGFGRRDVARLPTPSPTPTLSSAWASRAPISACRSRRRPKIPKAGRGSPGRRRLSGRAAGLETGHHRRVRRQPHARPRLTRKSTSRGGSRSRSSCSATQAREAEAELGIRPIGKSISRRRRVSAAKYFDKEVSEAQDRGKLGSWASGAGRGRRLQLFYMGRPPILGFQLVEATPDCASTWREPPRGHPDHKCCRYGARRRVRWATDRLGRDARSRTRRLRKALRGTRVRP